MNPQLQPCVSSQATSAIHCCAQLMLGPSTCNTCALWLMQRASAGARTHVCTDKWVSAVIRLLVSTMGGPCFVAEPANRCHTWAGPTLGTACIHGRSSPHKWAFKPAYVLYANTYLRKWWWWSVCANTYACACSEQNKEKEGGEWTSLKWCNAIPMCKIQGTMHPLQPRCSRRSSPSICYPTELNAPNIRDPFPPLPHTARRTQGDDDGTKNVHARDLWCLRWLNTSLFWLLCARPPQTGGSRTHTHTKRDGVKKADKAGGTPPYTNQHTVLSGHQLLRLDSTHFFLSFQRCRDTKGAKRNASKVQKTRLK